MKLVLLSLVCAAALAAQDFIQMSDPQFGMFTKDASFEHETVNFEFAIATANRLKPAFVVITGDLINKGGDPAQAAEYKRISAKLDPKQHVRREVRRLRPALALPGREPAVLALEGLQLLERGGGHRLRVPLLGRRGYRLERLPSGVEARAPTSGMAKASTRRLRRPVLIAGPRPASTRRSRLVSGSPRPA